MPGHFGSDDNATVSIARDDGTSDQFGSSSRMINGVSKPSALGASDGRAHSRAPLPRVHDARRLDPYHGPET